MSYQVRFSSFFLIPCLFSAFVEIIPLDRGENIECPGDIILYNCSIQSNSEAVHLTWRVTLPGEIPISITYPNPSISFNSTYITTSLTGFRSDEFIHSTLEVSLQPDILTEEIMIECSIGDLGNDTAIIDITESGT